jgi:hypothetical protein
MIYYELPEAAAASGVAMAVAVRMGVDPAAALYYRVHRVKKECYIIQCYVCAKSPLRHLCCVARLPSLPPVCTVRVCCGSVKTNTMLYIQYTGVL